MNRYKDKPFFELFLRFYLTFFVVVVLFKIVIKILQSSFQEMKITYLSPENFQFFIGKYALMAMFYALFITVYYKFIKRNSES